MITIIAKGVPLTNFIDASVTRNVSAMTDYFSFTASAVKGFPSLREGDPVTVAVDGIKVLTGFIDTVSGSESEGGHTVTYAGRDRTCDFVDSQIDIMSEIVPSDAMTLKRVIETVVSHLGAPIEVIDDLAPAPFNKAEDKLVPAVGEGAFSFVAKFARKRNALLSSTPDGNILITQSSTTDSGARVYSSDGAANMLSQSWTVAGSAKYRKYVVRGQTSPSALDFSAGYENGQVASQTGSAEDSAVREGRQSVKRVTESYGDEQLGNQARWVSQLSRARATTFRCTVKGHTSDGGAVWAPNTLVFVSSAAADISRKMLLASVTLSQSEGSQSVAALAFVERDVYTIDEKITSQRPVGDMNDAFKTLG